MKKKLALLLASVLVLTMFAGCSKTNTAATSANAEKLVSGQKYTVQFWHELNGANFTYLNNMIKSFNDAHPDIQVVPTYQGTYNDGYSKLQAAVASGSTPDVVMIERAFVSYFADSDALLDLNPYFTQSKLSTSVFVKGLMGFSNYGTKLVSLPFNRSEPVMYVNKTLLDSKGLSTPTTWDELKKVANACVEKTNGAYTRYGMVMPFDTWYPMAMTTQTGGKFLNEKGTSVGYTTAQGVKVFTFLKDMQSTGALYYPPVTGSGDAANSMFSSGKAAIMFQSTGVAGGITKAINGKFQYKIAYMPKDTKYSVPTGGANLAVPAKAKNKAAAWEFLKWIATDEKGGQQFILDSGYLPFTTTMAKSTAIQKLWTDDPNRKVAYDQIQYANDTNRTINWPSVNDLDQAMIQAIMYDNADINSSLAKFKTDVEKALAD